MAVTQEHVASQPINEGGPTLRNSPEHETDSHSSQIEGGERTFLSWLILPLLSLCSCGRGGKSADEDEAIHPFPHTLNSPQCLTQPQARSLPAIEMTSPIGAQAPAEEVPIVICEQEESRDHTTTITRYEGYAYGSEVRSRSGLTLVNSPVDDVNGLHLIDLPLLPLLTICEFLFGDGSDCRDIFNLRNTCRSFADVVNIFFQNPAMMPKTDTVRVQVMRYTMDMEVEMSSVNYLLHPLNSELDFECNVRRSVGKTTIDAMFNHEYGAADIGRASKFLLGRAARVSVNFTEFFIATGAAAALQLLANISLDEIHCSYYNFNNRFGDFILTILRKQSMPKLSISVYQASPRGDGAEFLAALDSLTHDVTVRQHDRETPLNLPLAHWQQWLQHKLQQDGCNVRCNYQPFTAETDLTQLDQALGRIEWSRKE